VEIFNTNGDGSFVTVSVQDLCGNCGTGDIMLTPGAFEVVGDINTVRFYLD
jgi:expansin (peptidoglycan-binding protein)